MCGNHDPRRDGIDESKDRRWPHDYRPSMFRALVLPLVALTMCGGPPDDGQSPELREAIKRKNKALDRYLREERQQARQQGRRPGSLWFAALGLAMCGSGDSPEDEILHRRRDRDRSTRDFLDEIGQDPWRRRFAALARLLGLRVARVR